MRILFATQFAAHFHYFKSIIRSLLKRGHTVRLVVIEHEKYNKEQYLEAIEEFKKEFPNFECVPAKMRENNFSAKILFLARDLANYRRYFFVKNQSAFYSERLIRFFPLGTRSFFGSSLGIWLIKRKMVGRLLDYIENSSEPSKEILEDIKNFKPDVLLASPVNMRRNFFMTDLEYLKAAKKMGLFSALPIISWDNLTTKGIFHVWPDLFLVWNEVQRDEAREHHGIPEEKMKIIGAPLFDGWFGNLKPSESREEFCKRYGLDPSKPILLYLGSSKNMSPDESWVAVKVREALDDSQDEKMKEVQIAIRPHPSNYEIYEKIIRPGIVMVPKEGILPNRPEELQLFYDSLYYSTAALDGVNTSGIIDATIMDKPGIVIFTKEHEKTQRETQHFRQLVEGKVLYEAEKFEEVPRILRKILEGSDEKRENRRKFVLKFIRPLGRDVVAGEAAADELEKINGIR